MSCLTLLIVETLALMISGTVGIRFNVRTRDTFIFYLIIIIRKVIIGNTIYKRSRVLTTCVVKKILIRVRGMARLDSCSLSHTQFFCFLMFALLSPQ